MNSVFTTKNHKLNIAKHNCVFDFIKNRGLGRQFSSRLVSTYKSLDSILLPLPPLLPPKAKQNQTKQTVKSFKIKSILPPPRKTTEKRKVTFKKKATGAATT